MPVEEIEIPNPEIADLSPDSYDIVGDTDFPAIGGFAAQTIEFEDSIGFSGAVGYQFTKLFSARTAWRGQWKQAKP